MARWKHVSGRFSAPKPSMIAKDELAVRSSHRRACGGGQGPLDNRGARGLKSARAHVHSLPSMAEMSSLATYTSGHISSH